MRTRLILSLLSAGLLFGETADLPSALQAPLEKMREELSGLHLHMRSLEEQVKQQAQAGALDPVLLQELRSCRVRSRQVCQQWRECAAPCLCEGDEAVPWDIQEGTLGQLLSDYAPPELVYLVPQELSNVRVHLHSRLPIPSDYAEEFLETVLAQIGIGIRRVHPLLRELFLLGKDLSQLKWLLSDRHLLSAIPAQERVGFLLHIRGEDAQQHLKRLQPFTRSQTSALAAIGDWLAIMAPAGEVLEILKLSDFLGQAGTRRDYRLVNLVKSHPEEMARLLQTVYAPAPERPGLPGPSSSDLDQLKILPLSNGARAVLLVGTPEQLRRADQMVADLEKRLDEPTSKVIYHYTCAHTPPEELAAVLERVACMLQECQGNSSPLPPTPSSVTPRTCLDFTRPCFSPPSCPAGPVNLQPIGAGVASKQSTVSGQNFIVDGKTGSILMVVEQRLLPQLQELIRKLDVPKRMVQLDVLLVERRIRSQNRSGLNLLRIGTTAADIYENGIAFDGRPGKGLFEFLLSREETCTSPAYDLVFNFLLNQEELQINANPSVLTLNQTPASISLVEEISINNGAVSCCEVGSALIQKSYVRAQYGITLVLTPTIHLPEGAAEPGQGSITLESNITFDSTKSNPDDRPEVARRHIENQVCIADGETVVLGGLRRRISETAQEAIPFVGEIPGLGKLFSSTSMDDAETEMFIFITPRILLDPKEQLRRQRQEDLLRRPGDLPEFMACLLEAQKRSRQKVFARSVQLITGEFPGAQRCPNESAVHVCH
jgi:general secretion pathway protein D